MAGVDSVSSMLYELGGGLGKEFPPFSAMGEVMDSYLNRQTWSAAHPLGNEGSLMFGAAAPSLTRTTHATISAVPARQASFQAPMNQSNLWDQQRGSQSERDFIPASSPSQMAVRSHMLIDQADIRERQQQRSQTEQASVPMAFPSHGAAQSHVMIDENKLQDQQRSLSNQGHLQRDAFDEFVLFDRPKPAQVRGDDFQDGMKFYQPKSQTDQPSSSCRYVELNERSRTDPRHASSSGVDASSLSSLRSNHPSNILPNMSGIAHPMHPSFTERTAPGLLVQPNSQTDPSHLTVSDGVPRGMPRIDVGTDSACSVPLIFPRSPTVPEGILYQYQVDEPLHQPKSQTVTDAVPNLRLMQPRSAGQPALSHFQNRPGNNLPTNQTGSITERVPVTPLRSHTHNSFSSPNDTAGPDLQVSHNSQLFLPRNLTHSAYSSLPNDDVQMSSGSDHMPLDYVPRSLSEQALPLQDMSPSIESIIAMSQHLLRQAQGMRDQSMAHQQQACAGPAGAESPPVMQNFVDNGSDIERQESESESSGSDYEVLVGPTELVSANLGLCNLFLPSGNGKSKKLVPLISRPHMVAVSDGILLARAQSFEKPLSFGSTLHLMGGALELCRPCMFEQRPGRCRKSYCCDFCHVGHHRSSARKAKNAAAAKKQSRGNRGKFATT